MAYAMVTLPPSMVQVDSNDKNHENVYYGIEGPNANSARLQYFIEDLWGNTYILKVACQSGRAPMGDALWVHTTINNADCVLSIEYSRARYKICRVKRQNKTSISDQLIDHLYRFILSHE